MNNLSATSKLCTAICSSFYPDERAIEIALFNAGIIGTDEAQPKDKNVFMVAVTLVRGYVESSRSEGGISVSVDRDAVNDSILFWAREYGVVEDDVLLKPKVIENGSYMW